MQLTEAVQLMGPSLALHVFAVAGLTQHIPHSEWFAVFQVVRSPAALRAHGHDPGLDQVHLARAVAREMCRQALTFDERLSALDTMIECESTNDQHDETMRIKYNLVRTLVSEVDTLDKIERVYALIEKASSYWHVSLSSTRERPRFRAQLLETSKRLAHTFNEWHRVCSHIERDDGGWGTVMDRLFGTAESIQDWAHIHNEIMRLDPTNPARRERAVAEIVKRLAE